MLTAGRAAAEIHDAGPGGRGGAGDAGTRMTPFDLSVRMFLALAVILVACRLAAAAFSRLGQPPVVAEMIAGVLLGPSFLGQIAPAASAWLFPAAAKPVLFALAQLGLVLYMFLVGVEFDVGLVRRRLRSAAAVSAAGILVPFALGCAIAAAVAGDPRLFAPQATRSEAMLFLGAAMSITAFPMLARIIVENGIAGTALGTLALAAGSTDDVLAWCVLAIVLASFANDASIAVLAIGGSVAFALFVVVVARRALAPVGRAVERRGELDERTFAWLLALVLLAAWYTDAIRIYAVFGAFLAGTAMPRGLVSRTLVARVRPLSVGLLLPVFFTYSGLNTRIDMLDAPGLWLLAAGVLAAAVIGKGGACYLAARALGESHADALAVGALMNARGLMELIILNIGLERGLLRPALFAIMVAMAIVTTLAATPVFRRARAVAGDAGRGGGTAADRA
jgi:Kef-type K+ transport system membrane component KefB